MEALKKSLLLILATITWPLLTVLIVIAHTFAGFAEGVRESVEQTRDLLADRRELAALRYFHRENPPEEVKKENQ